jgi:hypothetical protein
VFHDRTAGCVRYVLNNLSKTCKQAVYMRAHMHSHDSILYAPRVIAKCVSPIVSKYCAEERMPLVVRSHARFRFVRSFY